MAVLVRDLVAAANARLPFAYRVEMDGTRVTLVGTSANSLDRRVTIPAGTRSITASADRADGLHVLAAAVRSRDGSMMLH